jgi:hypothetical protein
MRQRIDLTLLPDPTSVSFILRQLVELPVTVLPVDTKAFAATLTRRVEEENQR